MNNDLISRSELKKALAEIFETVEVVTFDDIIARIDNAQTVEPDCLHCKQYQGGYDYGFNIGYNKGKKDIPQGEWIERTERITLDTYYECSNCKEPWTTIEGTPWQNMMKFCPNCGARMEGNKAGKENDNE